MFIAVGLISLFIILLYIIFKQNNLKKKANRDLILVNETIQKQKGKIEESAQELLSNKNLIENKNAKLEQANEMINSGIRYAARIQQGIIPTERELNISIDNYANLLGVTLKVINSQSAELHNEAVTEPT